MYMKDDIQGAFGRVAAGSAAWAQEPLYRQATERQRQEIDTAMQKIDADAGTFEHTQAYGDAVMKDAAALCANRPLQKSGAATGVYVAELKDVQQRMDLHLCGAQEIRRRYSEDYIPEAAHRCAISGDPADQAYVGELEKRRQDFADRTAVLQGAQRVVQKTWLAYGGQDVVKTACPVSLLKKIVLKKPLGV